MTETNQLGASMLSEGQMDNPTPNDYMKPEPKQLVSVELEKLGESLGEFKPYDSQLPIVELEGTRIVKCLYQTNKETGKKVAENSYVRLPVKHLSEEVICSRITELSPYVLSFLQEVEDKMIRESHKNNESKIYCDYLSLDKLIERLEVAEAGARLNKDKIEAWFVAELEPDLITLFCAKLGIIDFDSATQEQLGKLTLIINAYKKKFASLASGKTFIKEEDCISMLEVITSCEADKSIIGSRFVARLRKMGEKEDDLLMSL